MGKAEANKVAAAAGVIAATARHPAVPSITVPAATTNEIRQGEHDCVC